LKVIYFTHSLQSCWNHGNAHFLRGVMSELTHLGHQVVALEPQDAWSLRNLRQDHGEDGLQPFLRAYPELTVRIFGAPDDYESELSNADLVIVHEWNDPELVARMGRLRAGGATFTLLFHDTHHRAVSDPDAIRAFDLDGYDGILAFGEALADVYRRWGWRDRVWVWHEAADLRRFHPPRDEAERSGLVWIGNWGDGERSEEIERFLLRPASSSKLSLDVYGVRYPDAALGSLADHGAKYRGWLANACAPQVFAKHLATVHVPRRFYVDKLPGIPTIRVFEALACGIPLISAPWHDTESLFRPGQDFLVAQDGEQMTRHMIAVRDDAQLRSSLALHGMETIRTRHSCAHRVQELLAIYSTLSGTNMKETAA
jgi:spore maturation protein CgeB